MIDYSLCLVTDEKIQDIETILHIILQAIKGGVFIVQLREKTISTKNFVYKATKIKSILDQKNIPLIINDRVDVALAIDAAGIHLGQDDIPYDLARKLLGKNKIIGLSVSTAEEIEQARTWDVDYFGVGAIFKTQTKDMKNPVLGLEGLKKIRNITAKPIIGIGGINKTNAKEVINAGADGIAVVSAICGNDDPFLATLNLKTIISKAKTTLTRSF